jgi:hypothetical protein
MAHRLAESIHITRFESATVVLSLKTDRYLLLVGALHEALRSAIGEGEPIADHVSSVEQLVHHGILTVCPSPPDRWCPIERFEDARTVPEGTPLTFGFLAIFIRLLATVRELRRRPLEDILVELEKQKLALGPGRPVIQENVVGLVGRVHSALRLADWIMGANKYCLPRSICAMRLLLAAGLQPRLVMAVMERPFDAHSWVECGGYVVTDRADRVIPFNPILVL